MEEIIDMMIKDKAFRIALATKSPRLFFGTYLGHYAKYPFAPFHFEMFWASGKPRQQDHRHHGRAQQRQVNHHEHEPRPLVHPRVSQEEVRGHPGLDTGQCAQALR